MGAPMRGLHMGPHMELSVWELQYGGLQMGVPIWRPPYASSYMENSMCEFPHGGSHMGSHMEASMWELPYGGLRMEAPI